MPERFGPIDQPLDRAGAVQQAVMAMAMQMNERAAHAASLARRLSIVQWQQFHLRNLHASSCPASASTHRM